MEVLSAPFNTWTLQKNFEKQIKIYFLNVFDLNGMNYKLTSDLFLDSRYFRLYYEGLFGAVVPLY